MAIATVTIINRNDCDGHPIVMMMMMMAMLNYSSSLWNNNDDDNQVDVSNDAS
jgi:hypothetical protein